MSRKDRRASQAADRKHLRLVAKGEAHAHKPVPPEATMKLLGSFTAKELEKLGLVRWTRGPWAARRSFRSPPEEAAMKMALYLFPASWYAHIPGGTEIADVSGNIELFLPNETDSEAKHGLLPYGIMVKLS